MDNQFISNWKTKINATLETAGKDIRSSMAKSLTAAATSLTFTKTAGGKTRFFGKILEHGKITKAKLHKAQATMITRGLSVNVD